MSVNILTQYQYSNAKNTEIDQTLRKIIQNINISTKKSIETIQNIQQKDTSKDPWDISNIHDIIKSNNIHKMLNLLGIIYNSCQKPYDNWNRCKITDLPKNIYIEKVIEICHLYNNSLFCVLFLFGLNSLEYDDYKRYEDFIKMCENNILNIKNLSTFTKNTISIFTFVGISDHIKTTITKEITIGSNYAFLPISQVCTYLSKLKFDDESMKNIAHIAIKFSFDINNSSSIHNPKKLISKEINSFSNLVQKSIWIELYKSAIKYNKRKLLKELFSQENNKCITNNNKIIDVDNIMRLLIKNPNSIDNFIVKQIINMNNGSLPYKKKILNSCWKVGRLICLLDLNKDIINLIKIEYIFS